MPTKVLEISKDFAIDNALAHGNLPSKEAVAILSCTACRFSGERVVMSAIVLLLGIFLLYLCCSTVSLAQERAAATEGKPIVLTKSNKT